MKERLHQLLDQKLPILVAGDIMLDSYVSGTIERISPEAPVPVLNQKNHRSLPGGAGNVARNLAGLNSRVHLVGLGIEDSAGLELRKQFSEMGVSVDFLESDGRPTTGKTRFVSGSQQVLRLDEEDSRPLSDSTADKIITQLETKLDWTGFRGLLLSDYNKGFCHWKICHYLIDKAGELGIPVVVDPKGTDWKKYRGATLLTPNVKELSLVRGTALENEDRVLSTTGKEILRDLDVENLLITRSEKGMTLLSRNGSLFHQPTRAREVFDVSGAGDTVAASMMCFIAGGSDLKNAAALANRAAALVVAHWGTYPIGSEELIESFEDGSENPLDRLLQGVQIQQELADLRRRNLKIVFTNGCFDLLHRGHVSYLQQARALGDRLILGLNSDESVKKLKGPDRPLNDEESRALLLLSLRFVDYVVIFSEDTPFKLIKQIQPDVLVKGGDYKIEDIVGREFAKETVTLSFVDGFSTTGLIKRMHK